MFSGSIVALITPFDGDEIDETALRRLVNWHIEQGTHGIVPAGTTGESPTLSHEENRKVNAIVVNEVAGRVPVIAGAGSNSTREAINLTLHATEIGADATLHVAGYYNRPHQEGLYQHFKALHDATDIPIIVYNIPPRAIVDVEPDTLARMAELPRIVGVKDATADLSRPLKESARINKDFCFLSGEDPTAIAYNANGGQGCISVTANVAPMLCSQMQKATLDGDFKTALEMQRTLMPLHEALFKEPSPAGVKYAVSRLGHCADTCRLPVVPLMDSTKDAVDIAMDGLGLLG